MFSQLNENSIFKDAAEKAELLTDEEKIKDLFWICTLGILALQAEPRKHIRLRKFLKDIDKTRINNINDEAHDMAVMTKIAYDKGLLPNTFVMEFTKLLFILKTNPQTDLDESKIRDLFNKIIWTKMIPSPRIRSETKDFLEGKISIKDLVVPYYYFAKYSKIAQDFRSITYSVHKNITKTVQAMRAQKIDKLNNPTPVTQKTTVSGTPIPKTVPPVTARVMVDIKDYRIPGKDISENTKNDLLEYLEKDARKNFIAYFILLQSGHPETSLTKYSRDVAGLVFSSDAKKAMPYVWLITKIEEIWPSKEVNIRLLQDNIRSLVSVFLKDPYTDISEIDAFAYKIRFESVSDEDNFRKMIKSHVKIPKDYFPQTLFMIELYLEQLEPNLVKELLKIDDLWFQDTARKEMTKKFLDRKMFEYDIVFVMARYDMEAAKRKYLEYANSVKPTESQLKKLEDLGLVVDSNFDVSKVDPFSVKWIDYPFEDRRNILRRYLDLDPEKYFYMIFLTYANIASRVEQDKNFALYQKIAEKVFFDGRTGYELFLKANKLGNLGLGNTDQQVVTNLLANKLRQKPELLDEFSLNNELLVNTLASLSNVVGLVNVFANITEIPKSSYLRNFLSNSSLRVEYTKAILKSRKIKDFPKNGEEYINRALQSLGYSGRYDEVSEMLELVANYDDSAVEYISKNMGVLNFPFDIMMNFSSNTLN